LAAPSVLTFRADVDLFHHPGAFELASSWRDRFRLCERSAPPADHPEPYLWAVDDHLELHAGAAPRAWRGGVWVKLDEVERRAAQGGELARACGSGQVRPWVLDAMGGWGVDGLVLALRGCRVSLVERHPLISALQQDLVRRFGRPQVTSVWGDGFAALDANGYDVIYLDPMFPQRGKGALPGKRMQVLSVLAEPDPRPLTEWLEHAIAAARQRVVLKRRDKDPAVAPPDWQIRGRKVRFDVYRGRRES
jgi:16S rRNA (guanine1516-N2)-methyltransferase